MKKSKKRQKIMNEEEKNCRRTETENLKKELFCKINGLILNSLFLLTFCTRWPPGPHHIKVNKKG